VSKSDTYGVLAHIQVFGLGRGVFLASFGDARRSVAVRWPPSAHPVWLRPRTSDPATFREVLLWREYDFAIEGPDPTVIVDVGANIGLSAIWFATRFPSARIICLEPESDNFALLERNIAPYPSITALRAALWSTRGTLAIGDPLQAGGWAFQTSEADLAHQGALGHVEGLTMMDVLDRFSLERIDLLKVDIEGAEREVFASPDVPAWIGRVDAIAVELHDRFKLGCSRAFFAAVSDFPIETAHGSNTFFVARHA